MKRFLLGSLSALALLMVLPSAVRADEFDRIVSSPNTYWVPAPTPPPPGYAYNPAPYGSGYPPAYGGYYGPPGPPPPPPPPIPRFFIGFHFH